MREADRYESRWPGYNTVWRWHFYAGLLCIPLVMWLSVTGTINVFKPQVEAWIDQPFNTLERHGPSATPSAWVEAALATVPGGRLDSLEVPPDASTAPRILVRKDGDLTRVYIHPETLQVLKVMRENDRLMKEVAYLHGELGVGDAGSWIVETAACWAIVMLLSGIFLWWPRSRSGWRGVLLPRLVSGQKLFWRDLHAVTGIWVCTFAMFLLLTGLPWAKNWGAYLKEIRYVTGTMEGPQDWSTGRSSERQGRLDVDMSSHEGHMMPGMGNMAIQPGHDLRKMDTLVPVVSRLNIAPPVLLSPPGKHNPNWVAKSDAQDRTRRSTVEFDPETLAVTGRKDFADRHIIDRVIGVGISAHEGQLFGWLNQALSVLAAAGLLLLSVSAVILWLRRRPSGFLGSPPPAVSRQLGSGILALVALLALAFPLFGVSLVCVLLIERLLLRRIEPVRAWLGLAA